MTIGVSARQLTGLVWQRFGRLGCLQPAAPVENTGVLVKIDGMIL